MHEERYHYNRSCFHIVGLVSCGLALCMSDILQEWCYLKQLAITQSSCNITLKGKHCFRIGIQIVPEVYLF
ncbi:hypothetical protein K2173_018120 [Erythroxylum novogranatense]|uniref:Uncharacterized protein n=1 Tax=Erythroxylum novogranatense TaxID=1862640 RepID=A0AAV8U6D2_9ROSI|nr:hypothetical protein K2173_018120 [Erythroxylum novogranatense]